MAQLTFSTTINAPVSKVWTTMLDHPTYEAWTKAFAENSTYDWERTEWSQIKFHDGTGNGGMLAMIAKNDLHHFISIKHLWEIGADQEVTYSQVEAFENYSFTQIDETTTKLDIELTGLPDEYSEMFNEMWPKALVALKELCEQ